MEKQDLRAFLGFAFKAIITHTLTYFIFGLVMSNVFDYDRLFQVEVIRDFMRPFESAGVIGPVVQPVRGLLFAVALWPIRSLVLEKKLGWLYVWNILVMVGILSTPAAAPCSIEGAIYSKLPLWYHLLGLPEIVLQTLVFSLVLVWWDKRQYQKAESPEEKPQNTLFAEIMRPVSIGCFAYIGYAVGAVLFVFISGTEVDMDAAAGDLKTQLMFVVAFVVNVIAIVLVSKPWLAGRISIWLIFVLFWAIDAAVPFLYQLLVFGESSLPVTLMLGLLPAAIIAFSIRLNYKRPA